MFSPRILIVFGALWSMSTQNVVFKDDSSDAGSYGADNAPNTGVRSGPLDDSIVVEAPGGDTNTRFFGGLGGAGLLGGGKFVLTKSNSSKEKLIYMKQFLIPRL